MRKKPHRSNSDRKIEQLYLEALRTAKQGNLVKPTEHVDTTTNKNCTINGKEALEQAVQQQQERLKQRQVLRIQVTRLYPFYSKTEGKSRTVSRCSSDVVYKETQENACNSTPNYGRLTDDVVKDTLQVCPLKTSTDEGLLTQKLTCTKRRTPIYRTSYWANTIRLHSPCASIPGKGETGWRNQDFIPLLIEREELHSRSTSITKDTISLAEKRVKLKYRTKNT